MRFWDREEEVEDLKAHFEGEPNTILFLYGPKSSGKSTVLMKVVEELKREKKALFFDEYDIYWFDLRGKMISSYESVVDMLFATKSEFTERRAKEWRVRFGIRPFFEVERGIREGMVRKEIDPFGWLEGEFEGGGRRVVIVFDELQRLKWVYVNGGKQRPVVNELFNFFVRISKVRHLAHVVVATSDTFFIEEVYRNSALQECAEYKLLDYFDEETTKRILAEEGFSREEAEFVWEWIGGVPWELARVIEAKRRGKWREKIGELYRTVVGMLEESLLRGEEEKEWREEEVKKLLRGIGKGKPMREFSEGERQVVRKLVELEVLFYDPLRGEVRPQTKLMEKAIREVFK